MTGVQPSAVMEDDVLFHALSEEARKAEWTDLHRLLARNLEATHDLLRVTMMMHGGFKQGDIPDPVRITEPGDDQPAAKAPVVSATELARMLRGGGGD